MLKKIKIFNVKSSSERLRESEKSFYIFEMFIYFL